MFRRDSHSESSDNDKTFNFNYEIDIDKKKGGETFNKEEGFDFNDFPDLREDRSQKSYITSQRKILPSELVRRSEDNDSSRMVDTIEYSGKKKGGAGGSFIEDIPPIILEEGINKHVTSPKFPDITRSYKTAANNFYLQN